MQAFLKTLIQVMILLHIQHHSNWYLNNCAVAGKNETLNLTSIGKEIELQPDDITTIDI